MKLSITNFIDKVRSIYKEDFVPLHRPILNGNEIKYLKDCINSNFVSSAGEMIIDFEKMISSYTKSKYAISTSNGTSALHISLLLSGVEENTEVITQALTFVATGNAISYCNAKPIFLDVDKLTMGLCPQALSKFLKEKTYMQENSLFNKSTDRRISACVPMHTFGHPCQIEEISNICKEFNLPLVEDAAESLGSFYKGNHTGKYGLISAISFNGNKVITTGGGGMIVTDDENLAKKAKHLTTTAKIPHQYEYIHDEIGYNYRMPNLNAALGIAQFENLKTFLEKKRKVTDEYASFFDGLDNVKFFKEPESAYSNYWLNAIILNDSHEKNKFLKVTNEANIMTRPIWKLLSSLDMFADCETDELVNSKWLEKRVINIPSSVPND